MRSQFRAMLWVAVFLGILALIEAGARSKSSDSTLHTASGRHGLDPSNFLVVLIAALVLVYGANRALRPPFVSMDGSGADGYEEMQEAGSIGILLIRLLLWLILSYNVPSFHLTAEADKSCLQLILSKCPCNSSPKAFPKCDRTSPRAL